MLEAQPRAQHAYILRLCEVLESFWTQFDIVQAPTTTGAVAGAGPAGSGSGAGADPTQTSGAIPTSSVIVTARDLLRQYKALILYYELAEDCL